MGLFKQLDLATTSTIDWEMTPEYTFGTFESWGGKERVRSDRERVYYFFIDSWGDNPKLCLMERGIKHARVIAEIMAPPEMVRSCVDKQGRVALFERSFAIDEPLKQWLLENIIDAEDDSQIIPIEKEDTETLSSTGLPHRNEPEPKISPTSLPADPAEMSEEDVAALIAEYNLFDTDRNTAGRFANCLVDNGDNLTVSDRLTGLMWQREGLDIMSNRMLRKEIERLNKEQYGGYSDWRIPTPAEALSLMEPEKNDRDQHLHPCFSSQQPFIFVAATRSPGGYWFVDYKQGRAFWASGTIPGGFGRLCRADTELR